MAKLIYLAIASLDGYIADELGKFDWAAPDDEVHRFINQIVRPIGTHLYGRRMYDVMTAWETLPTEDEPFPIKEFADLWRPAEKIVYSRTLETVSTARTRLAGVFDPGEVRRMKAASTSDLSIGGPTLAAHAFRAGLIDSCHLFVAPVLVGNGLRAFPDGLRLELTLRDERRFSGGMAYLHYTAAGTQAA